MSGRSMPLYFACAIAVFGAASACVDEPQTSAGDAALPNETPAMLSAAGEAPVAQGGSSEAAGGAASGSLSGSDGAAAAAPGGAGAAAPGGAGAAEMPAPGCVDAAQGAYCGPNLVPTGELNTRYFCSSGTLVAEAACPGFCDPTVNACVESGGSASGAGDFPIHRILEECPICLQSSCAAEYSACLADPQCTAHLDCASSCDAPSSCYAECVSAVPEDTLTPPLFRCLNSQACNQECMGI